MEIFGVCKDVEEEGVGLDAVALIELGEAGLWVVDGEGAIVFGEAGKDLLAKVGIGAVDEIVVSAEDETRVAAESRAWLLRMAGRQRKRDDD